MEKWSKETSVRFHYRLAFDALWWETLLHKLLQKEVAAFFRNRYTYFLTLFKPNLIIFNLSHRIFMIKFPKEQFFKSLLSIGSIFTTRRRSEK
jgi:hypothetical protein